jgi:cytidylate kinase
MKNVLLVTGTCGVGKSTVCRTWANRKEGASIECDIFRTWIRQGPLRCENDYQEQLILKHASELTLDYLNLELDVAIDNVWSPESISYMIEKFSGTATTKAFYLHCHSTENHRRDLLRVGSNVMGERLDQLDRELRSLDWPNEIISLDSTHMDLNETITKIESYFE